MSWWAILTRPPTEIRDAVAQWLARDTGQAVEEREDGVVVGFVQDDAVARDLVARVADAFDLAERPRIEPVVAEDWSTRWRDGIECRSIGRLVVGPTWLLAPGPDRVVVDPEMAFGTGEHGSTRSVLALLTRHLEPGSTVLDLGSGSGILAIAAAKLGAARAVGIEIDPDAEPIAQANVRRNQTEGVVTLLTGDASVLVPLLGSFDLVVSNILRSVNGELLPTIAGALAEGGVAVFGGMERVERSEFASQLEANGWSMLDEADDAGWWAVAARAAE